MYVENKSVKGARIGSAFIDLALFYLINFIFMIFGLIFMNTIDIFSKFYLYITFIYGVVIAFIYYTLLPFLCGGSTLGKLMTGIKVVSYNYKKASFWQLLFRNVYLFNAVIISGISLLLQQQIALFYSFFLSFISFIIYLVIFIMILATSDCKGIHDIIVSTQLVSRKFNLEKVNEVNVLERKSMEWAEFDDEVDINKKAIEDKIEILETKDEIKILKPNKDE